MECPEWMNADFFDEIYQNREDLQGKKYTISGISCSEVVGAGDNYVSVMYRAKVEVEVEGDIEKIVDSFIVKSMDNTMQMFKDFGVFPNELEAYQIAIPECEKLWKDAGNVVDFGPKCLKATTGGQEVLVLSDLKRDGYIMMDRFKGLDLKCAEMTLKKLAQFHAASIAYKEKVNDLPVHLSRNFMNEPLKEMFEKYVVPRAYSVAKILEINGFDQKYADKVRMWSKVVLDEMKIIGDLDQTPDELQCLLHADLWVNNQMYKLDESGKPTEVLFIDFQFMIWGRPYIDILSFLISSVKPEIVVKNYDYLIKYYHENLIKSMETLSIKKELPSLKNFLIELQKYGFYVLNCLVEALPAVLLDRTESATMENFIDDGESGQMLQNLLLTNPKYLETLAIYLPFFDNKGLLDSDLFEEVNKQGETLSEMECPQWMTGEFFDEIYKERAELKGKTYKINVESCSNVVDLEDVCPSKVFRANVDVEVEGSDEKIKENFIIKSSPSEDSVFPIELEAYTEAIPAITQYWKDIGESIEFGPRCLKSTSEPNNIMVLSDLKQSGYIMLDRLEGLDLEHAKITLRKLAKFHAGSVLYQEKNGSFGPYLSRKYMEDNYAEMYRKHTQPAIDAVIQTLESINFNPEIMTKIKNLHRGNFKQMRRITDPDSDHRDLKVLTHGDLWLNNQMFKYDEDNKLMDVIFVDFKISYWGRPATDILYFLVSTIKPELVVENFNSLLEEYYNELLSSFEKLGVEKQLPPFAAFLCQFKKCGYYAASSLFEIVPIVLMEKNDNAESDEIMKSKMYNNPRYQKMLELYLPFFNEKGYLDLKYDDVKPTPEPISNTIEVSENIKPTQDLVPTAVDEIVTNELPSQEKSIEGENVKQTSNAIEETNTNTQEEAIENKDVNPTPEPTSIVVEETASNEVSSEQKSTETEDVMSASDPTSIAVEETASNEVSSEQKSTETEDVKPASDATSIAVEETASNEVSSEQKSTETEDVKLASDPTSIAVEETASNEVSSEQKSTETEDVKLASDPTSIAVEETASNEVSSEQKSTETEDVKPASDPTSIAVEETASIEVSSEQKSIESEDVKPSSESTSVEVNEIPSIELSADKKSTENDEDKSLSNAAGIAVEETVTIDSVSDLASDENVSNGHVNDKVDETQTQNEEAPIDKSEQPSVKMSADTETNVMVNGSRPAEPEPEKQEKVQRPGKRRPETHDGPKWMDRYFFSDILRKEYDSFKVITYKVEPANKKGENYASMMYRVKMNVENNINGLQTKSLIAKVNHESGMGAEMMKIFNVFPKEIEMYDTIIPEFERMYKRVGDDIKFGPKCLLASTEPADLIIMEDLSIDGYRTSPRQLGLDMQHCKLVLEKLAKFHAASAVHYETKGPYKPNFDYGIYGQHMKPVFKKFFEDNSKIFVDLTSHYNYSDKLRNLYDNWEDALFEKTFSISQRDDKRFNVLNHGDMWSNNIMFHYDESGKPESCLLVDYQMCNYNSPAFDLHYFIFTSVQMDIRMENIDFFVQFYHQHLILNLKKLGYKGRLPKLLELQRDFLDLGFYGYLSAFGTMAVVLAPGGDDSDMDTMMATDEKGVNLKKRMYTNPVYVKAMNSILPYFCQKGYLEYP